MLSGKSLHAPHQIDHEMISVAVKKSTASGSDLVRNGLEGFSRLRLVRHSIDHKAQLELAISQNVSAYDGAYLQLAVVFNAPLATYDLVLAKAAERVFSPS